ncbi:Structure-Specific Endonuclease Subunit Slx4 [Manis pentadactyla]|nr:Structure-Specific Endonuclease Subunit Slx4 [Manis pentadactyla]
MDPGGLPGHNLGQSPHPLHCDKAKLQCRAKIQALLTSCLEKLRLDIPCTCGDYRALWKFFFFSPSPPLFKTRIHSWSLPFSLYLFLSLLSSPSLVSVSEEPWLLRAHFLADSSRKVLLRSCVWGARSGMGTESISSSPDHGQAEESSMVKKRVLCLSLAKYLA